MRLIKWFWSGISFRNWTFEGRKLAHPITIIRKIIIFPFLLYSVFLLCIIIAIFDFSLESGIETFEEYL